MDLITGMIGIALAIVFAIVIYFISVSSMKEKTYDEVKAEHKKKAEEYLAQGRNAKEKAKDKKLKKAGKKVKEKSNPESIELSSDEFDNSKGHVAFVERPVILEEEPAMIEEKEKKKNKKKEKPILINKNEITPVVDVPPPTVNHFEQIVPKDDFTLKHSLSGEVGSEKFVETLPAAQKHSTKSNKPQATLYKEQKIEYSQSSKPVLKVLKQTVSENPLPAPGKKIEKSFMISQDKSFVQKPVEEVAAKSSAKFVHSSAPTTVAAADGSSPSTKGRKKRNELATLQQMSGEKDAVNVSLLMPLVHKAELSRTEIQVLIDVLLNKQQGSSVDSAEWIEGRADPIVKLKKQLAEKEKALVEEQESATALQSKLKELRIELNSERHNTRQHEDSLTAARQELAVLNGRLQHSAEEKQALVQQIQQLQAKLSEEHTILCKLQEDQGQTQSAMQQELLAQRQQLEMHIARLTEQHQETIVALETQMASQIQEQEAINSSLSNELSLLRERGVHLQDSAAQSQDLARQIKELHSERERLVSKVQYDTNRLQSEVNSLTDQLGLKRAEVDKLSSLVQNLQTENNRLTHQISSACLEAQQLRDENEILAAQLTASMERPATEGRENGDVSHSEIKHINSSSDKIHEKELIVEKLKNDILSKEKEIGLFKTDLAQKDLSINSLKEDLDIAHTNSEKMLKEISSYKCIVQEQESVIKALREEGDSAHKLVTSLREDIGKNKAEILRLSKDTATREQLESRESTIEKLTSELNTHKTKLADQAALIQRYKADLNDNSKEVKLLSELNKCTTELSERDATIKTLTVQASSSQATLKQLSSELEMNKENLSKLSQEVKELTDKHSTIYQELLTQKRKNDELRSKNWKVMEALSTTEKTLETKMKESQQRLANEAVISVKQEEQERTKQLLQRIMPNIIVDSKQGYDEWLEKFMGSVCQTQSHEDVSGQSQTLMLTELEHQNCQLQAMVTHYKAIISDTEGMLNRLQSHVEQEEGRWGQQIQTLEAQLEAVIQERDRLQVGLKSGLRVTVDDGSDTN